MTDSGRTRNTVVCFAFVEGEEAVNGFVWGAVKAEEPDSKAVSIKRNSIMVGSGREGRGKIRSRRGWGRSLPFLQKGN